MPVYHTLPVRPPSIEDLLLKGSGKKNRRMKGGMMPFLRSFFDNSPKMSVDQRRQAEAFASTLTPEDPHGVTFEGSIDLPANVKRKIANAYIREQQELIRMRKEDKPMGRGRSRLTGGMMPFLRRIFQANPELTDAQKLQALEFARTLTPDDPEGVSFEGTFKTRTPDNIMKNAIIEGYKREMQERNRMGKEDKPRYQPRGSGRGQVQRQIFHASPFHYDGGLVDIVNAKTLPFF